LSNPQCQLTLGQTVSDYIRSPNDQVWYSIQLPATVDPRTLVQVTAGYAAPSTPVNLGVNLLTASDGKSLGILVDNHSQGAPRPVNFIVRYAVPNGKLLVFLSDQSVGRPNYDPRNPFTLTSQAIIDPDPNHPNNIIPTPLTLTDQGGIQVGANYGYLSTTNEVDKFSFTVAPFSGRKIIYVHVAQNTYNPPVPYLLSYQLFDPNGVKISEDHVANQFLAPNLATARLSIPGTYVIVIQGYNPPDSTADVPGDLRARFDLDVKIMDDVDANEPNDTLAQAPVRALGVPLVGRLSYVADNDWYAFDLPASGNPTVIHYLLTPLSTGGRFPPIPKPYLQALAREIRVFTQVTTGQPDNLTECKSLTSTICPKGYEPYNDPWARLSVETFCQLSTPPLCLQSAREESVNFANLKNFEGALLVPPHGSTLRYFLVVRDAQDNWADDKDYQLYVEWLNAPDEASFYSGGVKQTKVLALSADGPPPASFPTPPPGSTQMSGTLSYGYGRWNLNQVQNGQGVRAEQDYDSIISDTDRYELDFPGSLTTSPVDLTWELQWQVAPQSGGASSYDLSLQLQFCDGNSPDAGAGCVVVDRSSSGAKLALSYTPAAIAAWHNPSGPYQPAYDRATPPSQTVTARAYGCFCFEPRFVRGGKFFVNVGAVDRNTYTPAAYQVLTAFTSYPQSYQGASGMVSCPPVADGGCRFTQQ
jgi:hypothetical protein